jgi:Zn-dependent protease with chaperone function
MDQGDTEFLISRMEQLARDKPGSYRRRVFWLAALGYAYLLFIFVMLAVLTGMAIASVAALGYLGGKLALLAGALLFAVARALWVRLEPPAGVPLGRTDAPEFFRLLDALQVRLKSAPIHQVLVTPDLNAGVTQVPRLGILGWHRNYLLIGVPLIKALTVEQFKSVLAHEIGHLSRGHARAANWIYRLRIIWARMEAIFERRPQWGSGLIRAFFKWYIPYFNAVSFPFARSNEYEADAASVMVTSSRGVAQALTGIHVTDIYLEHRYWPTVLNKSASRAVAPFEGFVAHGVFDVPEGDLQGWVDAALAQRTSHSDTHPSLADRLKAIGAVAELALPAPRAGAEKLLGASLARLEKQFDASWNKYMAAREDSGPFAKAARR